MKSRASVTVILSAVLLSGCVVTTECDWTKTHSFKSQDTVRWLLTNDRQLLVDTIVHNETRAALCR